MQRRTVIASGLMLTVPPLAARTAAGATRLRIGLTAVILADQAAFLSRWSEYLSLRLGLPVVFVARESYQAILDLLFSDQVDAVWMCGYPYVLHQKQLRLLAVPTYGGEPRYQSYLIRTRGSKLAGWADLKQQVLAYSDPLSNSGWLVAQAQLRAAGLGERDLKRSFFAYGHRNVAEAVSTGLAQAGSIDGYVWETMQLQRMASVANTEVIWKSEYFGFPPVVARTGERHPALAALSATLMKMHADASGRDLLRALNLTGFASPNPAQFDSIRAMLTSLKTSTV